MDSAPSADLLRAEDAREGASGAWRHAVRVRAVERSAGAAPARSRAAIAGFAAVALHLLLLGALREAMRPPARRAGDGVVTVRLIEPVPARIEPAPKGADAADGLAPDASRPARLPRPEAPRGVPAPAPPLLQPSVAVQSPRLFGIDGGASLPQDFAERLDRNRTRAQFPQTAAASPLLATRRPLKVRPNHFAQAWSGTDGQPLHETLWRHLTVSREFTAPWGGRYGCAWILIVVACADIPDRPWQPPQTWKPATELDAQ